MGRRKWTDEQKKAQSERVKANRHKYKKPVREVSEIKGDELEPKAIVRAIEAFRPWTNKLPHKLYHAAIKNNISVEGFVCRPMEKPGRGPKKRNRDGQRKENAASSQLQLHPENTSQMITALSDVLSGCTEDASTKTDDAISLAQLKASKGSAMKWDQSLHQLVRRQ